MALYAFVDEHVAFGPMPLPGDIDELSRVFGAVVVLVEEHELEYDLDEWGRRGVEVLHVPTPDMRAPPLPRLHRAAEWILGRVEEGRKVFIHCYGGVGRSGTVAAAYLAMARGMGGSEAVEAVREARPGAVEAAEQESMVRAYAYALRSLGAKELGRIIGIGEEAGWGTCREWGASKAMQLALRLGEDLRIERGCVPLLLSKVLEGCSISIEAPYRCPHLGLVEGIAELVKPLAKDFDRVADVVVDAGSSPVIIQVACTWTCPGTVEEAERAVKKLGDVLGADVVVEEVPG